MMLYVTQSSLEFLGSSDSVASISQESGTIGPNFAPNSQSVNRKKNNFLNHHHHQNFAKTAQGQ